MSEDWKDKPHWTLRFNDLGTWEIVTPDGSIVTWEEKGVGVQSLNLHLEMGNLPRFEAGGILLCP